MRGFTLSSRAASAMMRPHAWMLMVVGWELSAAAMEPLALMTAFERAGFMGRVGTVTQRDINASLGTLSKTLISRSLSRTWARFSIERTWASE